MSQTTEVEQDQEQVRRQRQATQTAQLYRSEAPAIPAGMRMAFVVVPVAVLLVLSVTALTGSLWAFAWVFVPTAIVYIAGAMYLFKRLMDYHPPRRQDFEQR